MSNIIQKTVRYAQGIVGLQENDIILTSFPKSGNTWVRFFLCNLISICEWEGKTVDFTTLDQTMPELGIDNLLRPWKHDTVPRIVKTHKHFWSIFLNHKIILIVRDPRDVMVSYYHFETTKERPRFKGTFSEFIRHRKRETARFNDLTDK